jgi:DNA-binding transcriptional LysR family regulator
MELRHLRYFVAVAEECHFGRAARRLFMSQPPLSRQIRDLEDELGVALLERSNHQVKLTDAGQQFLEGARLTLTQADRAVSSARMAGQGRVGFLSIGYIPTSDLGVLPRVLRPFRDRYPHVELELRSVATSVQIRELRSGRIHLGFLRLPVQEPDIRTERLYREALVAVLPERHPLSRARRLDLRDLSHDRFIMFPRSIAPNYHDMLLSYFQKAGFSPSIAHEADNFQTHLGLVSAGLGVSLLPGSVREIHRRGAAIRPLREPAPFIEMAVAYLERNRSEALRAFLGVVRECYGVRPDRD